jgi:hypothetical protein
MSIFASESGGAGVTPEQETLITGAIQQGKHTIIINASNFSATETAPATAGTIIAGTYKYPVWTFDHTSENHINIPLRMPKSWNKGTITYAVDWAHVDTATSYKVSWALKAGAMADEDSLSPTMGTAITINVDEASSKVNKRLTTLESSALTVGGTPSTDTELIMLDLYRVAADATNDTMNVVTSVLGVHIYYTVNASTDL